MARQKGQGSREVEVVFVDRCQVQSHVVAMMICRSGSTKDCRQIPASQHWRRDVILEKWTFTALVVAVKGIAWPEQVSYFVNVRRMLQRSKRNGGERSSLRIGVHQVDLISNTSAAEKVSIQEIACGKLWNRE